jgi:hypothetical protein
MNQLDKFDISIRGKDDKVAAAVPQLGLYATASDIHTALDALEWKRVEKGFDQLADPKSEMPKEKRQKILAGIRAIRERWWPFTAEAVACQS